MFVNTLVQNNPRPTQGGAATSKGARTAAARQLARELGPHGIRVDSINLGWMGGRPVEQSVEAAAKGQGAGLDCSGGEWMPRAAAEVGRHGPSGRPAVDAGPPVP